MSLALKIALRYFKGRNSTQAINIVSWISMGAVALSTTAMVVLFSVYNGLESYVKNMYTAFYPEVKVSVKKGKFFTLDEQKRTQLAQIKGISHMGISIEDMALLEGHDHQKVVRLKGVDNEWFKANEMDRFINTGTASWPGESVDVPSNIGVDIVAEMGIELDNTFQKIQLYYPKANASFAGMDAAAALNGMAVAPYASFRVQPELDGQYFLVPLKAAQNFFNAGNQISSVEIAPASSGNVPRIMEQVKAVFGPDFEVQSRLEQNRTLFMATEMEKWMIYGILLLVLVIASFNMVGALSMLAIEKKVDVSVLKSMGAEAKTIKKVFLNLGMLIAGAGAAAGLALGLLIVLSQIQWGWIKMGEGFLDAYPVEMQWQDFLVVCITVLIVGLAAGWYPATKAAKQLMIFKDE